jgi:ABC-type antimicrobial peptide transport system permease subunit
MPPEFLLKLFRWYCDPTIADHIEGDIIEVYKERRRRSGKTIADIQFTIDVLLLFRPGIIKSRNARYINNPGMIRNYFTIGWRNLLKHKTYSIINIGGLALGMSVAMMIGLWVHDELTFNDYFQNHNNIVQITKDSEHQGKKYRNKWLPYPLINELKTTYSANFRNVMPFTQPWQGVLSTGDKNLLKTGQYIDESAPESFTFEMVHGTWQAMRDPYSIILSESTAISLFGDENPLDRTVKINNGTEAKVTGVYKDFPRNSAMFGVQFFEPWDFFEEDAAWIKQGWDNHLLGIYAELAPNTTIDQVADNIREAEMKAIRGLDYMAEQAKGNPEITMIPMRDWHLRSSYNRGELQNGPMEMVWFIGSIGVFVLLLACINFMNLSTARSERRAKEVGIRKTMGSVRHQLVKQFFTESFFVVGLAFVCALLIVAMALPAFNNISAKSISMPWTNAAFWLTSIVFVVVTGLLAGSYPALYLSSFKPVSVLKGSIQTGKLSSLPRKILVVTQFTVSVTLIICTTAIYHQLVFMKNRPVGYDREGLIMVRKRSNEHFDKAKTIINELKASGAVADVAESGGSPTSPWAYNGGFSWEGSKHAEQTDGFSTLDVSARFGKTVGWEFIDGRDFNEDMASDTMSIILNESAVKAMGLKDPVGKSVHSINKFFHLDRDYRIVGVIKDMVMESPFDPVTPTMFFEQIWNYKYFIIRIDPSLTASEALPRISAVFEKVVPDMPFDYQFVDEEFAVKFATEDRVGKLAALFTVLAVIISCLGLSGLASFITEKRTKEIGIRKVLGASIANLWAMLSKEFIILVLIACMVSTPLAFYILSAGLENYKYRTDIGWWIFFAAAGGALTITLITVSYQAIRSALMNPVRSLRSE